jgi:hypothetical protein
MGYFALVWDNAVHSVAVSGSVPDPAIAGEWVDVTDMEVRPSPGCRYEDGKFLIPPVPPLPKRILSKKGMDRRLSNEIPAVREAAKTDSEVAAWVANYDAQISFNMETKEVIDQIEFLVTKNLCSRDVAENIKVSVPAPGIDS